MTRKRVGLLGCGTVGGGVIRLLRDNAAYLAQSVGAPLEVAKVLVRDREKDRVPELDRALLTTDPEELFGDPSIDVMVEVMGGVDPAFEGSVGGGIPVIRVLREALASDWVVDLKGIVNGTCNYMLSRMREGGLSFDDALREAQDKGYAEADPTLDVDGHDAAHKLVVLAMLAFGARVDSDRVPTEGIRGLESIDHVFAKRFGFVIKHLAIGRDHGDSVELRVHPALVRRDTMLANVGGVLNAIALEGRALGPCLLSGRGAGDMATAVSVVADVLDVARAQLNGAAGLATRGIQLEARPLRSPAEVESRHYLRFQVFDRPGVLASIAGSLGEARVSIEQMVQEGGGDSSGAPVQVVMLTHASTGRDLANALERIAAADFVAKPTRVLRVVDDA